MSSLHSLTTTRRSTRSRRGRAGLAVAAVVATVTPFAAACGSGFNAAALQVVPNAGAATVGSLKLNNVWVVVDPASGNAEVIGSLANTGNEDLAWPTVQVGGTNAQIQQPSGAGAAGAVASNPGSSGVPAGQSVSFGLPGQPQIEVFGASLTPGNLTQVVFSFGSTGNVTITAQIQSNTGLFADYNPDSVHPVPGGATSSASASPSESATSSASASASSSASASASASPSPSNS